MKTRLYIMMMTLFMLSGKSAYAQEYHFDVNNDGDVNITDAILLVNYILGKVNEGEIPVVTTHEAVDLGLPSGTKWASCNVGATSPEEYGGYYAWGEIEEKGYYDSDTYQHCDGSFSTYYDLGNSISGTEYDVAHVKWGKKWRMPTSNEFKELLDNCTHEWTSYNGVNVLKITSKANGNCIFLPCTGFRIRNELINNAASRGDYWSSTQSDEESCRAYALIFFSDSYIETWYDNGGTRSYGRTVRPVTD